MQRIKIVVAVLGLVLMASTASANPVVDPQIIIRDGARAGTIHITPGNLTSIVIFPTDPRCSQFTGTLLGSPVPAMDCGVVNESGSDLNSLTFTVLLDPSLLSFQNFGFGGVFNLSFNPSTGISTLTFTFATPLIHGEDLHIEFLNFDTNGQNVGLTASVPEPATFGLLLLGLSGLALRRRTRAL